MRSDAFFARLAPVLALCREQAAARDEDGAFPIEAFERLAAAGALAAPLPEADGGLGWGTVPGQTRWLLRLLTLLGNADLSIGRLFEGHANALQLIAQFATAEQRQRVARDVLEHRRRLAVWNTEPPEGVRLLATDRGPVLRGAKSFASGAGIIERPLITARNADGGAQLCLIAADRAPVRVDRSSWPVSAMRASTSFRIRFDDVPASAFERIGEPGDYLRQPWFAGGAIRFAAVHYGGAVAVFEILRDHLVRTGRGADPHQRARLGQAVIALEGARLRLVHAASIFDHALGPEALAHADAIVACAHVTRSAIERVCLDLLELAERSIGAAGFVRPHPLERIGRDLRLYLRQPAPDQVLVEVGRFALEGRPGGDALWP